MKKLLLHMYYEISRLTFVSPAFPVAISPLIVVYLVGCLEYSLATTFVTAIICN